jgi:hypothetical protein
MKGFKGGDGKRAVGWDGKVELEGLGAWVKLLQVHTVLRTWDSVGRSRPRNLTSRLLVELKHVSLRTPIS